MKQLRYILLISYFLSLFLNGFAQSRDYPKVSQNGKDFYLYEVKKSDGLYRISRKFKVSQEEILKYNQHAISGINKGMKLMIPIQEPIFTAKGPTAQNDLITHTVKTSETLYSIAKRYKVTANEIWDLNIEARNGIKEGMILKIPSSEGKKTMFKKTTTSRITSSSQTHTVLPKETLYSLSKRYNTTINDLININPELANGLKIGQVIYLPSAQKEDIIVVRDNLKSNSYNTANTRASEILGSTIRSENKSIIKVALLMPFMLNNSEKQDATIDKFVEFYEGVLLGVNQLKQENISVELITYDIEKSPIKVKEVLKANYSQLKDVDLIIGPAYSSQVDIVAEFAQENYIPLVVPFSPKIRSLETNPYVFQNNTPHKKQFVEASRLFIEKFSDKNIVILDFNNDIEDNGSEFSKFLKVFLERDNIPFKEMQFTLENYANIKYKLVDSIENIIVFSTEKANIIRNLLPKITAINSETTPISIFGFDSWNKTLTSYPSSYYYSSFFVDRKSKNNGIYRNKFRQEFGYPSYSTSPRFDLLGFDLTHYFVKAISSYGKPFVSELDRYEQTQTLQSRFKFEKQKDGGYLNMGVQLVHYTEEDFILAK